MICLDPYETVATYTYQSSYTNYLGLVLEYTISFKVCTKIWYPKGGGKVMNKKCDFKYFCRNRKENMKKKKKNPTTRYYDLKF